MYPADTSNTENMRHANHIELIDWNVDYPDHMWQTLGGYGGLCYFSLSDILLVWYQSLLTNDVNGWKLWEMSDIQGLAISLNIEKSPLSTYKPQISTGIWLCIVFYCNIQFKLVYETLPWVGEVCAASDTLFLATPKALFCICTLTLCGRVLCCL